MQLANTPQTQGWMDAARFAKMRADAFFVNASRGKIVDETALYDALSSGRIAGARTFFRRSVDTTDDASYHHDHVNSKKRLDFS